MAATRSRKRLKMEKERVKDRVVKANSLLVMFPPLLMLQLVGC